MTDGSGQAFELEIWQIEVGFLHIARLEINKLCTDNKEAGPGLKERLILHSM